MEDHAEILSMDSSVTALGGTLELCDIGWWFLGSFFKSERNILNSSSCLYVKGVGLGLAARPILCTYLTP